MGARERILHPGLGRVRRGVRRPVLVGWDPARLLGKIERADRGLTTELRTHLPNELGRLGCLVAGLLDLLQDGGIGERLGLLAEVVGILGKFRGLFRHHILHGCERLVEALAREGVDLAGDAILPFGELVEIVAQGRLVHALFELAQLAGVGGGIGGGLGELVFGEQIGSEMCL